MTTPTCGSPRRLGEETTDETGLYDCYRALKRCDQSKKLVIMPHSLVIPCQRRCAGAVIPHPAQTFFIVKIAVVLMINIIGAWNVILTDDGRNWSLRLLSGIEEM